MQPFVTIGLSAAIALLASVGGAHVLAQSAQQRGPWQMVAGSGGDGGAAWKINVDTGQSFFCYSTNCFPSTLSQAPKQ